MEHLNSDHSINNENLNDVDCDHSYSCEVEVWTNNEVNEHQEPTEEEQQQPLVKVNSVRLAKKTNSTSKIWNYFGFDVDTHGNAIDSGKPKCRQCFKMISCKSGNTSNLYKHLKDKHPVEFGQLKVIDWNMIKIYFAQ